jgi:signal transduction histidine kinase
MKTVAKKTLKPTQPDSLLRSALRYARTDDSVLPVTHRTAMIDAQGNIVAVNKEWLALAEQTGAALDRVGPGANYLDVCRRASQSSADSRMAANGIQAVLKQRVLSFAMDYSCPTPSGLAYFQMGVTSIAYGQARALITHKEVTEFEFSREKNFKLLQRFARRLINAQEEERQRISQEIHDDMGNRIALMALSIRQVLKQGFDNSLDTSQELHKVLDQIADLSTSLRDLSHGLHPPLLRHIGIKAALKALREKFERTYSIRMALTVAADLPRLPDEVALCIFRITQESLQNVAKHSGADRVTVVLDQEAGKIRLAISDRGSGFVRAEAINNGGLGLLSMEARALCVGGRLVVNSSPSTGTEIQLAIPLHDSGWMVRAQ